MVNWPFSDGSSKDPQSKELLKSWLGEDEDVPANEFVKPWAAAEAAAATNQVNLSDIAHVWNPAESLAGILQSPQPLGEIASLNELDLRTFVDTDSEIAVAASLDYQGETPFGRVERILALDSTSSKWLEEKGYLKMFTSPNCTLDMSFTTDAKVSAVLTSPEGFRRTVVCCPDGKSFQRITAPNGEEMVRFLSSGQVEERRTAYSNLNRSA